MRAGIARSASRGSRSIAAVLLTLPLAQVTPAFAACAADSGTARAVLVELYTSEGCSSCPPADHRLGELTRPMARAGPRVVPIALHVDYWDSIGWKDPFAQAAFAERQAWEVRANQHRTSFTPHFFVDGTEVRDWRNDLAGRLQRSPVPAAARIRITAEAQGASNLHVTVTGATSADARAHGPAQLFVVVTESGLSSQVSAGENRGTRLEHDAVARQWIGPIAITDRGVTFDRILDVPQLRAGHVGVVAFVQDATTAEVLQAVDTGICAG